MSRADERIARMLPKKLRAKKIAPPALVLDLSKPWELRRRRRDCARLTRCEGEWIAKTMPHANTAQAKCPSTCAHFTPRGARP